MNLEAWRNSSIVAVRKFFALMCSCFSRSPNVLPIIAYLRLTFLHCRHSLTAGQLRGDRQRQIATEGYNSRENLLANEWRHTHIQGFIDEFEPCSSLR